MALGCFGYFGMLKKLLENRILAEAESIFAQLFDQWLTQDASQHLATIIIHNPTINQWPFQDPKMEVPTIYKAYIRPM